ncbi:ABC transporter permease [Streptococcus catagoni]|uniref:ABC transporter permease n=1 Tax=Streptococcus catagoni TaxID=2654874 RepID=UPI00140E61D0|nr:ABC transporter permease [Streptococcus catagoni]
MKVAWSELKYQPKKFLLIELLIVLMIFMVIFLTGLTNGLGRAVSAQIENYGDVSYILSDDSEGVLNFSNLKEKDVTALKDMHLENAAGFAIQRSGIQLPGKSDTKDMTYFAIEEHKLLKPKLSSGKALSKSAKDIILDSSFKDMGVKLGDQITDKASKEKLTVVAFTSNAQYGHSPVGFISQETYSKMRRVNTPNYKWTPQAMMTKDQIKQGDLKADVKLYGQKEIIEKIPGYMAEHTTLTMITWVLLVASSAILGVFFYILTLQKLKQFGVLKAIGMSMGQISRIQLSQISLLAIFGVMTGLILASVLARFLPAAMPFYLRAENVLTVSLSFVVISIICGALSLLKIRKVDPVEVIGGNGE